MVLLLYYSSVAGLERDWYKTPVSNTQAEGYMF